MSDNSDTMKRVPIVHKEDRTLELANVLDMHMREWLAALRIKTEVTESDRWNNQRSPHALMVDCIHIVGRHTKNKLCTQSMIAKITKELWGMSTHPRANIWKKQFTSIIEGVLNEFHFKSWLESQDENVGN